MLAYMLASPNRRFQRVGQPFFQSSFKGNDNVVLVHLMTEILKKIKIRKNVLDVRKWVIEL